MSDNAAPTATVTGRRRFTMIWGRVVLAVSLVAALVAAVLWFYRRSFINFVDDLGPRYSGDYAPEAPSHEGQFKVVSWNIHYGKAIDLAIEELHSVPVLQDADVLLLQEMDEQGVEQIAATLHYNYVYYPASIHNKTGRSFGNAVLSKWPIGKTVKIVLPHASPHRNQRRIAVGAALSIDDAEVVAYSVHTEMPILPNPWRAEQLRHLAREIASDDTACVIVGGDFNTFTSRSVMALEGRMNRLGLSRVTETPQASITMLNRGFQPDQIFVGGLTPFASGVWSETRASDHFPLWTLVGQCQ